jgi:UDP:flavonoid glycosyltransferase YjiC (YdhE family)
VKVFCAAMPGAGHAHPMLAVAAALRARGHDVTFSSALSHEADATRAGVPFVPFPDVPSSPRHAMTPYADAAAFAEALAPIVARLAPDVAVVDVVTLGAAWAAEINDVPYATLCIHPLHAPSVALAPFGTGRRRKKLHVRSRRAHARTLATARAEADAYRARLGLPSGHGSVVQLDADVLLVAVDPILEPARPDWPDNAVIVGSCAWGSGGDDPGDPPGDGPLVLIAPTTAWDDAAGFEAAARTAVAAVGARTYPAGTFLDHDAVLPRCAAVISNGGGGITGRALVHGVPHVVVPAHGDQKENAYRVALAGMGVHVPLPEVKDITRGLRRALAMTLDARPSEGPVRAAEQVEALHARRVGANVTGR